MLSKLNDESNPPLLRVNVSEPLKGVDLGVLEVHRHDEATCIARLVANTDDSIVIRQRPFAQDTLTTNPWALIVAAIAAIIPDDPTDRPDP